MGEGADQDLTALYYPFSRCLDETTLKRAILLYDQLIFIDPKTPKVRAGLYSAKNHQAFLPENAAHAMEAEWTAIEARYGLLVERGVARFLDPAPLFENDAVDQLITSHMLTDMGDPDVFNLFAHAPKLWSILRSRIPRSAFPHLVHQYTPRVLYDENIQGAFYDRGGERRALFSDGMKTQIFGSPDARSNSPPETHEEYACVLPYYLGSSLTVSLALVIAAQTGAVPFTDSSAHHRLLALRYRRTEADHQKASAGGIAGLVSHVFPGLGQKRGLLQLRLLDSVLSRQDLEALTLEECLHYRDATADSRQRFRALVRQLEDRVRESVWSSGLDGELKKVEKEALAEYKKHRTDLLEAHLKIFRKAAVGTAMTAAPAVVATIMPQLSIAAMIAFGTAAPFTLKEPMKELVELWAGRLSTQKNGLAYLFELKS